MKFRGQALFVWNSNDGVKSLWAALFKPQLRTSHCTGSAELQLEGRLEVNTPPS